MTVAAPFHIPVDELPPAWEWKPWSRDPNEIWTDGHRWHIQPHSARAYISVESRKRGRKAVLADGRYTLAE